MKILWICNFCLNTFLIVVSTIFRFVVILPDIYKTSLFYYLVLAIETFIYFNLIGNLLACSYIDTSVNCIKEKPPRGSTKHASWHFCLKCDMLVPPRSIHCGICRVCILKREHHCSFFGRCIGHRNGRYFLMFLFYVTIGTVIETIHNSIYFWWLHFDVYGNWNIFFKLIFPPLLLWSISWRSAFLFAYELTFILAISSCVLLATYIQCFTCGATRYEFRSNEATYDLGSKMRNIETILGKQMYLVWLAPFIKSELTHDGINWESNNDEP